MTIKYRYEVIDDYILSYFKITIDDSGRENLIRVDLETKNDEIIEAHIASRGFNYDGYYEDNTDPMDKEAFDDAYHKAMVFLNSML